jgi:glycosyltransferase involved in cell wall biosynthesis
MKTNIVNCSNLKKGGALQVAHSFLTEIKENTEHDFHVVLSSALNEQINTLEYPPNFSFYNYSIKPSILKAITAKDGFLDKLEKTIKPDCIFTVFGPSYWIPKTKTHLMGYAKPHYIYPESPFYKKTSFSNIFRLSILKYLHKLNLKRSKAFFWVETEDVRLRLTKFLNIDQNSIYTISNTFHSVFDLLPQTKKDEELDKTLENNYFKFITITSYYLHKNLEILNDLVPILRKRKVNCKFYLTLKDAAFSKLSSCQDYVINLGPVPIEKCPELYSQADALFLPTLLECFTASYPEAMKMEKPILTSDLSFAHDICGQAAEYFDPLNPQNIADKIEKIISNPERRNYLIEKGKKRLKIFETSVSRAEKFLEICKKIVSKNQISC